MRKATAEMPAPFLFAQKKRELHPGHFDVADEAWAEDIPSKGGQGDDDDHRK
jgi:hypothetical protein